MRGNPRRDKWLIALLVVVVCLFGSGVGYYVLRQSPPAFVDSPTGTMVAVAPERSSARLSAATTVVAEVRSGMAHVTSTAEEGEVIALSTHVADLSSSTPIGVKPNATSSEPTEPEQKAGETANITLNGKPYHLKRGVQYLSVSYEPGTRTPEQQARLQALILALDADPQPSAERKAEMLAEIKHISSTTSTGLQVVRRIWAPLPGQTMADRPSDEESVDLAQAGE